MITKDNINLMIFIIILFLLRLYTPNMNIVLLLSLGTIFLINSLPTNTTIESELKEEPIPTTEFYEIKPKIVLDTTQWNEDIRDIIYNWNKSVPSIDLS
jgi:hypothetical protein